VLRPLSLPVTPLAAIVFLALAAALRAMPRRSDASVTPTPPRWDLPARMASATVLVVAITEAAPPLSPRLSGGLAAFPVYAAILTVFAHRATVGAAVQVLRGLLLGLFGFAGFFLVLGLTIERAGTALAFTAAIVTALAIQATSLALVLRAPRRRDSSGGRLIS
jgi:hypothetical protein